MPPRITEETVEKEFHKRYEVRKSGCWEWQLATDRDGYGIWGLAIFKPTRFAHRVAYTIFHGRIADDLCVCHTCDNPCCVNPNHLFLATNADNTQDKIIKNRARYQQGSEHHKAILDEFKVNNIIELLKTGQHSKKELAKKFGVSKQAIENIAYKRRWLNVQPDRPAFVFRKGKVINGAC